MDRVPIRTTYYLTLSFLTKIFDKTVLNFFLTHILLDPILELFYRFKFNTGEADLGRRSNLVLKYFEITTDEELFFSPNSQVSILFIFYSDELDINFNTNYRNYSF